MNVLLSVLVVASCVVGLGIFAGLAVLIWGDVIDDYKQRKRFK